MSAEPVRPDEAVYRAIEQVLARRAHALDDRDLAGYVDCYHEDAHYEMWERSGDTVTKRVIEGRAAIHDSFEKTFAWFAENRISGAHFVGTHVFTAQDDCTISVRSRSASLRMFGEQPPLLATTGWYDTTFAVRDGEWKISYARSELERWG